MRDTLTFRSALAAAGVVHTAEFLLNSVRVPRYEKNQSRVTELQSALLEFQLPKKIQMHTYDPDTFVKTENIVIRPLTYRDGINFPIDELSALLENVQIQNVDLGKFVTFAAGNIERLAEEHEVIILSVEESIAIKSTKFLALLVLRMLTAQCLAKIVLMEAVYIPANEMRPVVVVDDMSYSGTQLYLDHDLLVNVTFLLVQCTDEARRKLTEINTWAVKTFIDTRIPVGSDISNAIQYVDMGAPDALGAGALMFAPWKIPDHLSTFDMFWKGYVYIGNVITNRYDFGGEMDDLWIPIEWGGRNTDTFDATNHHAPESIFGAAAPFYKVSPTIASIWDQAFTVHNAKILDGIVAGDVDMTIGEPEEPQPKRQRKPETDRRTIFKGDGNLSYRLITAPERVRLVCHGINDTSRVVAQWFPTLPQYVVVSVSEHRLRVLSGVQFVRDVVNDDMPIAEHGKELMTEFERAIMELSGVTRITCIYRSTQNVLENHGYTAFMNKPDWWMKHLPAVE